MQLLSKLERMFGRFALPQLTLVLIIFQVVVYCMAQAKPDEIIRRLQFTPRDVLDGEYWRLASFLCVPPMTNALFAFFFWYLFYLMGTALENHWGTFRYNIFLLVGYLATVTVSLALAWFAPQLADFPASNGFWEGSVFLAFAYLYPDFELYLFFILPVKIKWFALVTWISYFLMVVLGNWLTRLLILASVCNFLLFFGGEILLKLRHGRRRMEAQVKWLGDRDKAFHRCVVCGITEKTDPKMEFRYCSQCDGACGYCSAHLHNHEHIVKVEKPADIL
jgi:hypothetical protein